LCIVARLNLASCLRTPHELCARLRSLRHFILFSFPSPPPVQPTPPCVTLNSSIHANEIHVFQRHPRPCRLRPLHRPLPTRSPAPRRPANLPSRQILQHPHLVFTHSVARPRKTSPPWSPGKPCETRAPL